MREKEDEVEFFTNIKKLIKSICEINNCIIKKM